MIPNVKLTTAGAALLAKTPKGDTIPATRWQIGKGALPSGSSLDRTALVDPVEYLDLYKVQNQGTESLILGQFTNQGMESGFPFEEVGLLAQDPDVGEILMCYGNAFGAGEEIQPEAVQLREFIFGTQLKFSGDANMTGVYPAVSERAAGRRDASGPGRSGPGAVSSGAEQAGRGCPGYL